MTRKQQPDNVQFGRQHGMPAEKAKDFRGAVRRLFAYISAEKGYMVLSAFIAVASSMMSALAPRVLGTATDEIFAGVTRTMRGEHGVNLNAVMQILLIMLALHTGNIFLNYAQGYIMAGVSMRIMYKLRTQLSEKIHRLPIKFFDKNPHGDILSRITNDVDTISNTLNSGLSTALMSTVQVLGIIIMMLTISPVLTLVAMTILPLSGICMGFIVKKSQKHFKAQQENLGKLNGHIEEMFTSHAIVKAFNGEKASVDAFDIHNEKLYNAGWKAHFLSGLMMPIIGFISNIGYVAIVVIGGALTLNGRMTVGGIQAFIQYTRQFGHPVSQLASVATVFQQTAAAAERVFNFLSEEEEEGRVEPSPCHPPFQGHISFENVSFEYEPDTPVIRDFSATIRPGQKIAIVGHTGAGKTTVVKLLMRFYDVSEGRICLDGRDIREYSRDGLRRHFGMVLQDTWLFSDTIAENIRYGKLDATDAEIRQAAKTAQAHHFIRTFPDSYNMQINEEADNISAGQKQLITIARTILADPDILILDEATSNVDTRTELQIQHAMNNLMKGRTCFVIAHRLSTIRSADLILVMQNGDIAEQGTHETLLASGGIYTSLYNSQF
ncbi:MAG: ABC transporter ATP-binding protein/permease [Defluviitaleaceae bacterium]|nr:ABC transporter ATP-binding protein/permease [Defluviitaleaceae bacterium]